MRLISMFALTLALFSVSSCAHKSCCTPKKTTCSSCAEKKDCQCSATKCADGKCSIKKEPVKES